NMISRTRRSCCSANIISTLVAFTSGWKEVKLALSMQSPRSVAYSFLFMTNFRLVDSTKGLFGLWLNICTVGLANKL
ncbi:hypothetical protein ACJX0J_023594, partial [Zea mays]